MGQRFMGNPNVLKENIERLREKITDPNDKVRNREILEEIRNDRKLTGKYYAKDEDETYNPFKEFFKK